MKKSKKTARQGFTLVELMLVLVILVAIAGTGVMLYGQIQNRAFNGIAQTEIQALTKAVDLYRINVGVYPTADEGLNSLCYCPQSISNPDKWVKTHDKISLDPWGNPYQYQYPGTNNPDTFDLWSCGPDGISGTDDDVTNWGNK